MCSCVCDGNIRSLVIISLKKKFRGRQAKGCCTCSKTQSRFQALCICLPSLADEMSVIIATYAHVKLFHGEKTKGEVPMVRKIPPLYKDGESFLEVPRNAFLLESMHTLGCTEQKCFTRLSRVSYHHSTTMSHRHPRTVSHDHPRNVSMAIPELCHIATQDCIPWSPETCVTLLPKHCISWPSQNCVTLPPKNFVTWPLQMCHLITLALQDSVTWHPRAVSHCHPKSMSRHSI